MDLERELEIELAELEDASSLRRGQVICDGRYEVLDLLGVGGFASVYKVQDNKLGGILALKILDPIRSGRRKFAERFYQEIRLTRQLQHHNTIKIYDAGMTEDACLYMTMELVDGEPLDEVLERERALGPKRAMRIAVQVLKSLSEAHDNGIVHRDLKPSNIMLCQLAGEKDYVKVVDFGIAKALDPGMGTMKTETGVFLCTPSYAAPEQLLGSDIGPSADIYSLALIIIEMMTGFIVMNGNSLGEIIKKQCDTLPVPIPGKVTQTPLGRILEKATQKDAADRYVTATEMLEEIVTVDRKSLNVTAQGLVDVGEARANSMKATIESQPMRHTTVEPSIAAGKKTLWEKRSLKVSILLGLLSLAAILTVALNFQGASEKEQQGPAVPEWADTQTAVRSHGNGSSEVTLAAEGTGDQPLVDEGTGAAAVAMVEGTGEGTGEGEATEQTALALFHLVVTSTPPGATVRLDDDEIGVTPMDLEVEQWEGSKQLTLRRRGYRTWRDSIEVDGPVVLVDARLRGRRAEPQTEQSEQSGQSEEDFDPFGQIEAR